MQPWYRLWVWNKNTLEWQFSAWAPGSDMAEYLGQALHQRYGVMVYAEWVG